jgi:hypothetical protein
VANHDPENNSVGVEIACELLMAIAQAGFTRPAQAVLSYALIQVCGPRKAKVALLDRKALWLGSGLSHESQVRRAIKELVDCKVLVPTPTGHYTLRPNYESWKLGDVPLLDTRQVAFCRSLRPIAEGQATEPSSATNANGYCDKSVTDHQSHQQISRDNPVTPVTNSSRQRDKSVTHQRSSRDKIVTNPYQNCHAQSAALEERGREEKSKNKKIHPPTPQQSDETPLKLVTTEGPDGSTVPFVGDLSPSQAELDRAFKVAEGLFPNSGFGLKAQQFATSYPVAWIVQALEAAAASEAVDIGWSYIWKILRRYAANGGPDQVKASGGHGGGRRGLARNEPALPPVVDPGLVRKRIRGSNPPTHHARGINTGWREVRA